MSETRATPVHDPAARTATVVLGLGNRLGGDDAVGPLAVARLAARLPGIATVEGAGDALAIVAAWAGFARVFVVDAARGGAPPGTVRRLGDGAVLAPKALARCSSHGGGLAEALALAEALGRTPAELVVFAVEAASFEPGAPLSAEVAAALEPLVERIAAEVADGTGARIDDGGTGGPLAGDGGQGRCTKPR